ncbi:MAG: response regulator transcription factor [Rudaea sp.]|uniref:response regulator transcription factor n=1 Tax=unclassified Rudaea TaxID=2627037 RepID=UPI0010F68CCB|nr:MULTISPECIES: response regulator transcription factor [unclassified Rudaea]MBN8886893.1 response regulator transcription factor [Rudaea sp.]MBR0346462.1 response regulator transcription factor [Rudaea sp.]
MRILLIEDEPQMVVALKAAFSRHHILLDDVATLAQAQSVMHDDVYDAMLLDRTLPDGDGMKLLRQLRESGSSLPVIVLTAKGQVPDRIDGLETGADDYISKPFVFDELLARLRAVLRRPTVLRDSVIAVGNLCFDLAVADARVGDCSLELPRREMLVLECLVRRAGRMVPRRVLMEAVFGFDDDVQSNALDSHISRLRRKLGDLQAGVVINVVRGVGYLLREQA